MARFGKRFRKARQRRQKRRQETIQTLIENRTQRIQARQEGKTARTGLRQAGKSDRIKSKAQGGFFLPESVQARQDTLMSGLKTAGTLGMAYATGGASLGASALGSAFGGMGGSPYGNGFATSGMESEYYSDVPTQEENKIFGLDPMLVYLAGGGLVLYLVTRRK